MVHERINVTRSSMPGFDEYMEKLKRCGIVDGYPIGGVLLSNLKKKLETVS